MSPPMKETAVATRRRWLLLALGAVLLAGPLVHDGYAKKPKSFCKAFVNGKRLKAAKRGGLIGSLTSTGFSVAGATKPKRGLVRTVTVTCGLVNLRAVPLGTTLSGCFGSYTEAGSGFREWTGPGMELTVEAFDGSRLNGRFRGVLVDASTANPTDASAFVEDGTFSMTLRDLGV